MAAKGDNIVDAIIYYVGIVSGMLGMGLAGAAVIKAMF